VFNSFDIYHIDNPGLLIPIGNIRCYVEQEKHLDAEIYAVSGKFSVDDVNDQELKIFLKKLVDKVNLEIDKDYRAYDYRFLGNNQENDQGLIHLNFFYGTSVFRTDSKFLKYHISFGGRN